MALLDDEIGLAVVGAERAALGAISLDQRKQVTEVARDRGLAEQHPHPKAALLQRLLEGHGLVVGADTGRHVGVERWAAHARRVTVDVIGEAGFEFRELRFAAADDAWEVHHLSDPDRAAAAQQTLDVARRERAAW